ncbi:MAG: CRISPR-associated endonuclease Cas2 [Candidatus Coprovivens sp.]
MRTIVFFDLPNIYAKDKRNYLKFRKYLINEGFIMMQESVYSKIVLNSQQSEFLVDRLKKNAPKKGLIQVLTITEKQYAQIEYIIGKSNSKIVDSEDRLVVL